MCTGRTLYDEVAPMAARGHSMCWAEAAIPFAYCNRCGAWGHRRTHHLAGVCGPPKASGLQALRRIRQGQHPLQRRGPGGVLLPRESVRTVATYDDTEGVWRRTSDGSGAKPGSDGASRVPRPDATERREELTHLTDATTAHDDHHHRGDPEGGGDQEMYDRRHMDAEGPRCPMDDEEDVFGFGGSLDQETDQRVQGDGGSGDAQRSATAATCGTAAATGVRSLARGTKSMYSGCGGGGAIEAIDRLRNGPGTTRTDSTDRLRAVRRRVMEKVMARCNGADDQCRDAEGDEPGGAQARQTMEPGQRGGGDWTPLASSVQQGRTGGEPLDGAEASDVSQNVCAACEGPGGTHQIRITEDVTRCHRGTLVATSVAVGGQVTERSSDDNAWPAEAAGHGEVTSGPPCGSAVPQDGTRSTVGNATGREHTHSLLRMSRGDGGGGPPSWRRTHSPQNPPQSLGVGPSIAGLAAGGEEGERPAARGIVRRRDGSADAVVEAPAARDRGGAAGPDHGKRPSEGLNHRTPGARQPECAQIKRSSGVLIITTAGGEGTDRGHARRSEGDGGVAAPGAAEDVDAGPGRQRVKRARTEVGGCEGLPGQAVYIPCGSPVRRADETSAERPGGWRREALRAHDEVDVATGSREFCRGAAAAGAAHRTAAETDTGSSSSTGRGPSIMSSRGRDQDESGGTGLSRGRPEIHDEARTRPTSGQASQRQAKEEKRGSGGDAGSPLQHLHRQQHGQCAESSARCSTRTRGREQDLGQELAGNASRQEDGGGGAQTALEQHRRRHPHGPWPPPPLEGPRGEVGSEIPVTDNFDLVHRSDVSRDSSINPARIARLRRAAVRPRALDGDDGNAVQRGAAPAAECALMQADLGCAPAARRVEALPGDGLAEAAAAGSDGQDIWSAALADKDVDTCLHEDPGEFGDGQTLVDRDPEPKRRRLRGKQPAAAPADGGRRNSGLDNLLGVGEAARRDLYGAAWNSGGFAGVSPSRFNTATSSRDRSAFHNRDGRGLGAWGGDDLAGWTSRGGRPPDAAR